MSPQQDSKLPGVAGHPRPGPKIAKASLSSSRVEVLSKKEAKDRVAYEQAIGKPGISRHRPETSGTPGYTKVSAQSSSSSNGSRPKGSRKANPYPKRKIRRPSIDHRVPKEGLEKFAKDTEITLGPLVKTEPQRHKVLCLLYHYRHLNGTDLKDLPPTDLIQHRVYMTPGLKPVNAKQKRYAPSRERWLRKLITEGMEGGVYESTIAANGQLSR